MGKTVKIPYESLLDIPESKSGHFEIRHLIEPAGTPIHIANVRTAMYGGHRGKALVYDHPTRWHELLEDGGRWTTDLPIEQFQQRAAIKGFRGRVLVGGLGLGVVVQMLTKYQTVKRIDVVEKAIEVCGLVQPHVGDKRMTVYRTDLFDFLRDYGRIASKVWDYAFFDIWTSDGEGEFYETVIPLRRLAAPLVKHRITCWNEDIMRGQVARALYSPLELAGLFGARADRVRMNVRTLEELAEPTKDTWHARLVPFYKTLLEKSPDLADPLTLARARFVAVRWAQTYDGADDWTERWTRRFPELWSIAEPYAACAIDRRQQGEARP